MRGLNQWHKAATNPPAQAEQAATDDFTALYAAGANVAYDSDAIMEEGIGS